MGKIVQEDFIILEHDPAEECWRFACGIAGFSFVELGINGERSFMTPGADVATIHTPVPGFNPNIYKQVNNYFKALKEDNAFWRANWLITPLEKISPFEDEILDGSAPEERSRAENLDQEVLSNQALFDLGTRSISELAIRSEYQTIFKLPKSGCIVFGIHSYIDPLEAFERSPKAAAMIERATNVMDDKVLKYRGLSQSGKDSVLEFCSKVVKSQMDLA